MGPDKFLRKTSCTRCTCPFTPEQPFMQAADNEGNFQAIALPGLEATWDCPREEREEGKALRRARRDCRREETGNGGEGYSQDGADDYYGSEPGDSFEEEEESESENSLESDLLDYEYHDNCSTYYDGRLVD